MTPHSNETMEVLVVIAFPKLATRASEEAWENDIVNAVTAAVRADTTIDAIAIKPLEYEDCEWVREVGTPVSGYDVTIFEDGSWHSGTDLFAMMYDAKGSDLQSLFEYLAEKGKIRK